MTFDAFDHVVHAVLGYGTEVPLVFGNLVGSEVPVGTLGTDGAFSSTGGVVVRRVRFSRFASCQTLFCVVVVTVSTTLGSCRKW